MDRLPRLRAGRRRDARPAEALSAADDLLGRAAPPPRRLSVRIGLAERARRSGGLACDPRLQFLLPPPAVYVHDRRPAKRRGTLRLPRLGTADRPPFGALAPPSWARRSREAGRHCGAP